jgi:hypothetical protein
MTVYFRNALSCFTHFIDFGVDLMQTELYYAINKSLKHFTLDVWPRILSEVILHVFLQICTMSKSVSFGTVDLSHVCISRHVECLFTESRFFRKLVKYRTDVKKN